LVYMCICSCISMPLCSYILREAGGTELCIGLVPNKVTFSLLSIEI
jgi:hypothetical protein